MKEQVKDENISIDCLKQEYENKISDLTKSYDIKIKSMQNQIDHLLKIAFGKKSEKRKPIPDNELRLNLIFEDDIEMDTTEEDSSEEAQEKIEVKYKRNKKKRRPVRVSIPEHLPRVERVIEPSNIPEGAKRIGEEISEQIAYNPGDFYVDRIIRPKYALKGNEGVIIGDMPEQTLPKSNAHHSLLSHILVSKFVDHLPFYRQIQIFNRQNLDISDSTMNNWYNSTTDLLQVVYDEMKSELISENYIQADESPIKVKSSHKKEGLHDGYMWVYRSPIKRLVIFDYNNSRAKEAPFDFLRNFSGHVQTDGYAGYSKLFKRQGIKAMACMAHARRKFIEAEKENKKAAQIMINYYASLYEIESCIRKSNFTPQEIVSTRKKKAVPILNKMKEWLDENKNKYLPKSTIKKAIDYNLNLWHRLIVYVNNADFEIDNNLIENSIRPLALGRKNYLFAGSENSANKIAVMYSLFASCKANNVNPYKWLCFVLENINRTKKSQISNLFPANFKK
jgi:transposase